MNAEFRMRSAECGGLSIENESKKEKSIIFDGLVKSQYSDDFGKSSVYPAAAGQILRNEA